MPSQAEALAAAQRVQAREEAAAAKVRQAMAAKADPVLSEVARRLSTARQHPGWAAFEQAVTKKIVETEAAYKVESMALAEGRMPMVFPVGGQPTRVSFDEAIHLAHIRLAELRGWDAALEFVKALIPADEEGGPA